MKANKPSTMAMVLGKSEKGQSLIEIIVALALASLVAVGLVRVTTVSIKGSRYSSDQSKITALAQRQIARIVDHENKDTSFWNGGVNYYPAGFDQQDDSLEGYCLYTTVTDVSVALPTTTPDYGKAKMAKINVKVFWDEKAGTAQCAGKNYSHSLSFDTYVTN